MSEILFLNELAKEIHKIAEEKGFYYKIMSLGELSMLVITELTEMIEADRRNKRLSNITPGKILLEDQLSPEDFERHVKNTVEAEVIDALSRVFDIAAYLEIDIDRTLRWSMEYNKTRPYKHGKKY